MKRTSQWYFAVVTSLMLLPSPTSLLAHIQYAKQGLASWYGKEFDGQPTASGKRFALQEMTAAHRTLPLGTKVMVENLETKERAEVKINDRGPYVDRRRRIIDLSWAAADSIGLVKRGISPVRVVVTEPAPASPKADYAIQVGAFKTYEEAHYVFQELRHRSAAAYITPRVGPLGRYYRVRVGPFPTEEKAQEVARLLKRQGYRIFLDEVPENT